MPKIAKLGRELRRIRKQIAGLCISIVGRAKGLAWPYLRRGRIVVTEGRLPIGDKIALFVVFQPKGLSETTFETLGHLVEHGFSPMVVCNGGARDVDIDRLSGGAWRVISRPNIGYDFGGYSDGIWFLREEGIAPERLLVLNDTLWLPALDLQKGCGSLDRLLALPGDYGALSNFVYRPRSGRSNDLVRKAYPSSFCFWISRKVWESEAFRRYWTRLPLHGRKAKVVEIGEVGFGRAMTEAGFPVSVLLDHQSITSTVTSASHAEKAAFVKRLPVVGTRWRAELDEIVEDLNAGNVAERELDDFLERLLAELNPWDSLVLNGLVSHQIDFVKKANLKHPSNAARFLEMATGDDVPLRLAVRSAIEAYAAQRN